MADTPARSNRDGAPRTDEGRTALTTRELAPDTLHVPGVSDSTQRLIQAARSPETIRRYRKAIARFEAWLGQRALDDGALADYIDVLNHRGLAPASARMVVSALRFRARLSGHPAPDGPRTAMAMQGLARKGRQRGSGQVAGLQWEQSDAVCAVVARPENGLAGVRDAAIIAVMSDAMLRIGECAELETGDVEPNPDGSAALRIRHSKTDPTGLGASAYLGAPTATLVRRWIDESGIEPGPLFRRLRGKTPKAGPSALSVRAIRDIIARRTREAGMHGRFSGHSMRVGSAQSLARAGANTLEMQIEGRWSDHTMPGHYAQAQLASQGATARLRYRS